MAKTTTAAAAKTKAPAKPKKAKAADKPAIEKKEGTPPVTDPKKTEGGNPPLVDNKPPVTDPKEAEGSNPPAVDNKPPATDPKETEGSSPSGDNNPPSTDPEKEQDKNSKSDICVVIPYVHSKANGEELKYALRAWDKHLPGCKIILIGDKPDYVSELVHHIEGLELGSNPQIDVAKKLMQAIASEEVSSSFIFTNDDIYPIAPVDLEDLALLRCNGILGQKKNATVGYLEKTNATIAALSAENYPLFDYGTHLPVIYSKYSLAQILAHFKAEEKGLLISSVYFNSVFYDQAPEIVKGNADGNYVAYIYRANPNKELLQKVFETRKFVNHNSDGYAPTLPLLEKYFPEASKFEN